MISVGLITSPDSPLLEQQLPNLDLLAFTEDTRCYKCNSWCLTGSFLSAALAN
jgi:hypothetical protein